MSLGVYHNTAFPQRKEKWESTYHGHFKRPRSGLPDPKNGRLTLVEQTTLSGRQASSSRGIANTTTLRGLPRASSFRGSYNSGGNASNTSSYHSALAVALAEDATVRQSSLSQSSAASVSSGPYQLPTPPPVVQQAAQQSTRHLRHVPHGYESYHPASYASHNSAATAIYDRAIATASYRPYTAPAAPTSRAIDGNIPISYASSPALYGAEPIYDAYTNELHAAARSTRSLPPSLPRPAARPYVYYYPPVALQPVHQPSNVPGVPVPPY